MRTEAEVSNTTIKTFGDDYALGNGSGIEFILSVEGLKRLMIQIDGIILPNRKTDEEVREKLEKLKADRKYALEHRRVWYPEDKAKEIRALEWVLGEREEL